MPFTATAIDQELDALAGVAPSGSLIGYASLHSAYSATGGNELSGGSPAYARVALSWSAAAPPGVKALASAPAAFNVPAGSTVAFTGLWSASSGGTFAGMGANGAATMYAFTAPSASPGVFTAPGSAYTAGQAVVLWTGAGGALPAGFTLGQIYYVTSPAGATFSLAATSGGAAINATSAGSGLVQAITVATFTGPGLASLASDSLSVI